MKKSLYSLSIATVLTLTSISSQAATDDLVYVAVDPCRIVDTRNAGGPLSTNTSRNFLVSGTSGELAAQGGTADCLAPRAGSKPLAISAYVLAIGPVSTGGVLTAFPAGDPDPAPGAGSTVNFADNQVIGNTTTVTLCDPTGTCPSDGEFAILARNTNLIDVVVDVQGYFYAATGSCPDDMVPNGDSCIDKYEASVWSTSTGGTQYGPAGPTGTPGDYPCLADGSDCGATAANPIYARSVIGVLPSGHITWYQAAQACANVGKRLPTTAEWQMAASGTPAGDGPDCNASPAGTIADTDANPSCISSTGALNMVGNVWEMTADLDNTTLTDGQLGTSDALIGVSLGDDFSSSASGTASVKSVFAVAPTNNFGKKGFRCAR